MSEQVTKKEKLLPSPSDSMGLQTYELFDRAHSTEIEGPDIRAEELAQFTNGETVELELSYPLLDIRVIDQHIFNLEKAAAVSPAEGSMTAEYRLAEAYLLKAAYQQVHNRPSQEQIDRFQLLNKEIYGLPDPELLKSGLDQLWAKLEAAATSPTMPIIQELKEGFEFKAKDGTTMHIPGLPRLNPEREAKELPQLKDETLEWLHQTLQIELAPVKELIDQYSEEHGEEFDPIVIQEIFIRAAKSLGMEIEVMYDENATALSWSSARNAVIVGGKRDPVKGKEELLGLFAHEAFVHGQRSYEGRKLNDESLTNGLFSEADEEIGEDPSYLTFEEGLATIVQKAVQNKKEAWGVASLGNYVNIGLAHLGYTSRQVYEVMSRVRMVLSNKDGDTMTPSVEAKARAATLKQVVRTFRGTPASEAHRTSDGVVLHYAKDLAYFAGKVRVTDYLNQIMELPDGERETAWKNLFCGKYDPMNRAQADYVATKLKNDIVR